MMQHLRRIVARLAADPLGGLIELGVWLLVAAIGVAVLIYLAKAAWGILRTAFQS
jgi:hypothetical protein